MINGLDVPDVVHNFIETELAKENGKLLYLGIHGSHLYGFESPDSDTDYRGMFITDTNRLLGVTKRPKDVIEPGNGGKRLEQDTELFEVAKEISLYLKGNCNSLERVNAPPVYITPDAEELFRMLRPVFGSAGMRDSYRGMAYHNYNKYVGGNAITNKPRAGMPTYAAMYAWENPGDAGVELKASIHPTCKKYLYVYRALMAGIYALETGRVEPNVMKLNEHFGYPEIPVLVDCKRRSRDATPLGADLSASKLDARLKEMFIEIDAAFERSNLPIYADEEAAAKVNDYLVKMRLARVVA